MLEGAKQEGTSDVAYSRNPPSVLKEDQERHGRLVRPAQMIGVFILPVKATSIAPWWCARQHRPRGDHCREAGRAHADQAIMSSVTAAMMRPAPPFRVRNTHERKRTWNSKQHHSRRSGVVTSPQKRRQAKVTTRDEFAVPDERMGQSPTKEPWAASDNFGDSRRAAPSGNQAGREVFRRTHVRNYQIRLEAPPGFEPGMEVLQISWGCGCC